MEVDLDGEKIKDFIIKAIAKIGEKISFRRFERITKNDNQSFGTYKHMGGKMSVLTLVNNANEEVAKDVAMHTCAMRPQYIKEEDVPAEVLAKEKTILTEQAINEGKPKEIAEKMVAGRIKKYFKEICLLDQPFIKDSEMTVGQYVKANNGEVVKMIRYEVGEGIEKRCDNFAEEVQSQINN
jgi:elongation factor Ts